jgi:arylsulfatase A-like enzyme/acetyl esterase/lipase
MHKLNLRSLAWLSLVVVALSGFNASGANHPNIIYILCDDLGYGDLRCLNPQGKIPTPHMDRLAAGGMMFTDAHSSSAVCTPSRYSILTGRYNWRSWMKHGVLNGFSPRLIETNRVTVAAFLKEQGYATACLGKWHLGMNWPQNDGSAPGSSSNPKKIDYSRPIQGGPTTAGFDSFFGISASLDMVPFTFIENDRVTEVPSVEKEWVRKGPAAPGFEAVDVLPTLTRKAVAYIADHAAGAKQGSPFFLYLPLASPHAPLVPTKEWQGKSGLNVYADFVMQTDATVGAVLDALERQGLTENTLVILTSDNGCSPVADFPALLGKGHNPSYHFRGTKADIFDGGHRIPFLVRWPARVKAGTTSDQMICLSDFFATCADVLGKKLPDTVAEDSVSILPALLGEAKQPLREAIVHSAIFGAFSIRQGNWKLELCPDSGGWSDPKPGSSEAQKLPVVQLYDLTRDIGETNNVQAEHPEIVARLTKLLEKYIADGRSTPGQPQPNTGAIELYSTRTGKAAKAKANSEGEKPADTGSQAPAKQGATNQAIQKSAADRGTQAEPGDRMFVYKKVGDQNLRLWVRMPPETKPGEHRPAAVFFHGGGWVGGPLFQFKDLSSHLASRGMVAVQVEYRFIPRGDAGPPLVCIQDARSAMRWVRAHAAELGIDPQRIAAGGGSAGGHLAAFVSMVDGCDDPQDDLAVSPKGNAQLLFNPVFDNSPGGYGSERMGERWLDFSPAQHISAATPPAIVFLGTQDKLVPVKALETFASGMKQAGVRCETRFYEGRDHGFFNKSPDKEKTIAECDAFLVSLGWLP